VVIYHLPLEYQEFTLFIVFSLLIPFIERILVLLFILLVISLTSIMYLWSFSGPIYSIVTFLIYITGILVLFSYVLVINPNFINSWSPKFLILLVPSALYISENPSTSASKSSIDLDLAYTFLDTRVTLYFGLVFLLLFALVAVAVVCFKAGTPLRKSFWVFIKKSF
jgi:hypothetical protein